MEKEPRDYEERAAEATEAPGEGQGWEQGGDSEAAETEQSTRADK